ncbi:aconitase X catalytic domain-containing protein [Candidatus Micrarchaeota archaeon]|nr:aconitase X catalytic domain-containing protein [Candidatus Micrarchaeota archaeon]
MELTDKEQRMLDGESGEAKQTAMEILAALGRIYGAKKMIPVSSAQVAGVSYKTIGDAGMEYLEHMAASGAKVSIPTFLNPAGMDIQQWKEMGIPAGFAVKQLRILDAYHKMGIMASYTCTPYLVGIRPGRGEHIAWAESSAIAFANSVLGARTNREGGPSALCAGICGVTPYYGLHLDENRVAKVKVKVEAKLKSDNDYGAMGYFIGEKAGNEYPAFSGIKPDETQLKLLGAAMAASGAVPLFYVKGVTPEYLVSKDAKEIVFSESDLKKTKERIDSGEKPDLVTLGCPHASIEEIKRIAEVVQKKKPTCGFWVCTARKTKEEAERRGYGKIIKENGGILVADTCMVVCPLEEMGFKITGANSGKAAKYLPSMCKQKVAFGDIEDILYR